MVRTSTRTDPFTYIFFDTKHCLISEGSQKSNKSTSPNGEQDMVSEMQGIAKQSGQFAKGNQDLLLY